MDLSVIIHGVLAAILVISLWKTEESFFGETSNYYFELPEKYLFSVIILTMVPALAGLSTFSLLDRGASFDDLPYSWGVIAVLISTLSACSFGYSQRKRQQKTVEIVVTALMIILFGSISLLGNALLCNALLDRKSPQIHDAYLLRKESRRTKSGSRRVFHVTDWEHSGRELEIRVSWRTFHSHQERTAIKVVVGLGFLRGQWVRRIERSDKKWTWPEIR